MKILLTTIESECKRTELALRYLYGSLADMAIDVKLQSFEQSDLYADIFEKIASGQHNAVYFHANEYNEWQLRRVADMLKRAMPSIAIIFGGMQVSFETRNFMKLNPFVDYVIRGEGENALRSFINSVLAYEYDFENIAGLAYREGDQVVVNPYDAPANMERLPFPYERTEARRDVAYYETIRGTSDRCVYAQYLPDPRVRALSNARVCTELRYFLAAEVKKVVILDRYFNYNSERAYRILEYIINNDNGITTFEFNMNIDAIDEETIRLVSEARQGQIVFNIDIASTNAEVLAEVGRNANIYKLMYNITKLVQNSDVELRIHMMAGLPLETYEMFARSFNKVFGMAEGMPIQIDELKLSKGTALRAESARYGYVCAASAPYEVISNGYMSSEELLKIRKISRTVKAYVGKGGFKASMPRILNDTGIKPFELFKGLASFIFRNGLDGKARKTENLARILYAYAADLYDELSDAVKLDILKEVIYSDLEAMVSEDVMKKFDKKGWDIELKKTDEHEGSEDPVYASEDDNEESLFDTEGRD